MIKHKSVNYIRLTSIPSTNTWVKEHASIFDTNKITCVTAEEQTAGRGTFSKKWVSPKGVNIYATLYFTVPKNYPFLQNLGQLLSIACCKHLETLQFKPKIKWPNDLLIDGKKFAGMLCEVTSSGDENGVALGIGLNVNMPSELLMKIDQPATSLLAIDGQNRNVHELLSKVINIFIDDFEILSSKGFAVFSSYYNEKLAFKDQTIQIKDGMTFRKGICKGVSPEGSLMLLDTSGECLSISSGKMSV